MLKKFFVSVICTAVLICGVFANSKICEAKYGETPEQFVDRCLYTGTWGWVGNGSMMNFNRNTVVVDQIESCDVVKEKAYIVVRFTENNMTCKAIITPENFVIFDENGTPVMFVKRPY